MMPPPRGMTVVQTIVCAVVFVAVGLFVAWHSLDYDWHWDDLHLIRPHSAVEIASSFTGTWDSDGQETKGFRPVTVLFNDLRARMFGESVRAHRLFLIVLYSVYLVALGSLVCRLGGVWWAGLVAGILTLCSKNSFYHYVWLSDGIHLVPGLLFVAAAHLLLSYLELGRRGHGALSGALLLAALAAREDALALYGAVLLVGLAYLWFFERPRESYTRLVRYAIFLVVTFLPFWAWRLVAVPSAPNFRANLGVLTGPLTLFRWTVSLSGQSGNAKYGFLAAFVVLLAVALRLPRDERRQSLLWLVLAAMTCLPGAVRVVPNLLFGPISFYAAFVALTMAAVTRRSRAAALAGFALMAVGLAVAISASRLEQLALHPLSTDKLYRDWQCTYGKLRFNTTPPARLQRTKANLARYGMFDETFDFAGWQQSLRERGRLGFIDDGALFVPVKTFLTP